MKAEKASETDMVLRLSIDEVGELYRSLVAASAVQPIDGLEQYGIDDEIVLSLKHALRAHARAKAQRDHPPPQRQFERGAELPPADIRPGR